MKVTLIGFKSVDFTDEDNGKHIEGMNLFISYPDADVVGKAAEKQFINKTVFDDFGVSPELLKKYIDKEINIEYNRRGKIGSLTVT